MGANSGGRGSWSLLLGRSSGGFGYNPRELRCFTFSIKRSARATSTEQSALLMRSSSWGQIADERSSRLCGASKGPPLLSRVSRPLCRREKFPAQIIWGKDDPALRMKKYAPHLLKALDLESYEVVYGRHFLQEDSSPAIASSIARLISAR